MSENAEEKNVNRDDSRLIGWPGKILKEGRKEGSIEPRCTGCVLFHPCRVSFTFVRIMVSRDFPKGLERMAAGWRNVRGTSLPSYQTFCQTCFTKYLFLLIGPTWRTRCPRGSMVIITTTMEGGKDSIRILRNFENFPCIRDGGESQNARGLKSPPGFSPFSFSSGNLSVKYAGLHLQLIF